jgi:hypothetical protein
MKLFSKRILTLLFFILILASAWTLILPNLDIYQIQIYMNNEPSNIGSERVRRCFSLEPNFNCNYNLVISGAYTKAITYKNNQIISESNWEVVE